MTPSVISPIAQPEQAIRCRAVPRQTRWKGWARAALWVVVAAGAFQVAYQPGAFSGFILLYLFALLQLAWTVSGRATYYAGLTVGLLIASGRLTFFWTIFSVGATGLWYVYAFWIALFVATSGACLRRIGPRAWLLIPFLWTGLEYFRGELYYLRFSWLNIGYAFAGAPWKTPLHWLGMYGTGFLLSAVACVAAWLWSKAKAITIVAAIALLLVGALAASFRGIPPVSEHSPTSNLVRVTGIQMEFPAEPEVVTRLNEALRKYPETDLLVLSEYTFTGPVPARIKEWCRMNRRYLVVGGEDPAPHGNFYNTSFVIGPRGEVVFRQVKSVPIQFFKDGLPAPEQTLWASPWGKIGFCICYDLSYRRVTDRLVKLGAEALIVPTMDVLDWGLRQHELHARVAPVRAAEYGLPIFRLASSGISQCVTRNGTVSATAPCPGEGAMLHATLELRGPGHVPYDSWLAPASVSITAVALGWLALLLAREKLQRCSPHSPRP